MIHTRCFPRAAAMPLFVPALCLAQSSEVIEREITVPSCTAPATGSGGVVAQPGLSGVGTGMTGMFATTLKQTGRFNVQERAALDELNKGPLIKATSFLAKTTAQQNILQRVALKATEPSAETAAADRNN